MLERKEKVQEMKSSMNKKYKEVKEKLVLHYHDLLYKAEDCRNEGISWCIIAIWNLGQDVMLSYVPMCLDDRCIEFLFKVTV